MVKKEVYPSNNLNLNNNKSIDEIALILGFLKGKYNISYEQIIDLIKSLSKEEKIALPVSIFNENLSCLETIVKYLKENLNLSYNKISNLLNRDQRTIWASYHKSIKKFKPLLEVQKTSYFIPISSFTNRKFSVLEIIVSYLKTQYNLSFKQISVLLKRDQRNIWTVYSRFRKKNEK